ncbi:Hypothetical glycosyl hydrolase family 15 [uncultured archaeon]|nr:Hypothetical glycosyl hydrolase family 15 [uncultured archaeon]
MEIRKISNIDKKRSAFMFLLLLGIPIFQLIPSVSSAIPDYDVNGDGSCTIIDFVLIANHLGETGNPGWIREDVDKNGHIDMLDMIFVSNHYGQSGWTNNISRIKKLSIAYSSTMSNTANQEFIASHFDMLDCSKSYQTAAANVKTLNPNITILGYYDACMMSSTYPDWNEVTQHEDWFVHDSNGNRVQPSGYSTSYLMDPDSGWNNYYAQQCKELLTNYPQFDGIFSDDVVTDLVAEGYEFTVPYSKIPSNVLSNWGTSMYQLIENAQTTIGSYILMPNTYKYMQYSQNSTHVSFWEHFIHGQNKAYNENGYGTDGWNYGLVAIDLLHEQAELGNIIAVNSGCENADSHPVEAKQWMLFTYACFSFAVVDMNKAYYSWQFFKSDSSHGYYPEMDTNLGKPIGDYYHVSGTAQLYARQFTNYYVAANLNLLGTGAVTFTINGASYTLSPRTAVFIQK